MAHFPVPDEFYADPQFLDATDAANVLWARAGSWSVHHRKDGLIPTSILQRLHSDGEAAAAELVRIGVWKRTRGGFEYVVWPRWLTRAYLEAQQESNRLRQANHRNIKKRPSTEDRELSTESTRK